MKSIAEAGQPQMLAMDQDDLHNYRRLFDRHLFAHGADEDEALLAYQY